MRANSLLRSSGKLLPGIPTLLVPAVLIFTFLAIILSSSPVFSQGKVLTVPPVNGTTTWGAITFNLRTKKAIRIDTIFVNTSGTGTVNLEVWYKKGPINGQPTSSEFTGSAPLWTNVISSQSVIANTNLAPIVIPGGLLIPANSYYGFYIGDPGFSNTGVKYGSSSTIDSVSDGTITIKMGTNIGYGWVRNGITTNHPRWFAGGIRYRLGKLPTNDASVAGILPKNFCPGTEDIKAVINNEGGNQIKSVKVNWTKNGVAQTAVTHSGTLDTVGGSGSTTATLKLGSHAFAANTPVDIKVWTSDPNSSNDTINDNDTMSGKFMASLSGTFTVGGTSPDYATLQEAADDLANFGVCGAVTLNIAAGTFTGRTIINEIPGTSSTNTVTIKGASKTTTTLTYSGTGTTVFQTIVVDGADHLVFKDLTIANTAATYGTCIHFANGADHNTVENCNITMSATATSAYAIGILGSGSATNYTSYGSTGMYNVFKDNTITGGAYGIRFLGSGTTATPGANGNRYIGNSISNYYSYGMYIYYSDSALIKSNVITTTRNTTAYGLYFYYGNNFEVSQNNINVPYYGLYMYYSNYYAWNGMSQALVANNMVLGTGTGYTLYAPYNYYVNYYYNTFQAGGTGTYNAYFSGATGVNSGTNIVGNIFVHRGANTAFYSTGALPNSVDHNIYYKSGSGNLAYMGVNYATLSAWQTAFPQYNGSSLQQDPGFKSTTDLHLNTSGSSKPFGPDLGLKFDVDGDARCVFSPTIGADESIIGKTLKPTAGMSGPDTVFVNSPTEFLGNQTPNIPHTNLWYVNGILVKDSVNAILLFPVTGKVQLKVVAMGCALKDSIMDSVVVVTPTSAPRPDFITNTNEVKLGSAVSFFDVTTGGPTQWAWEITPKTAFDANGNPVDRYAYIGGTDDSSQNMSIRFDVAGVYKVCLTAVNSAGSAVKCKAAYITVLPAYNLALTTVIGNEPSGYIYDNGGPNGVYSNGTFAANLVTTMRIAPCASEVYLIVKSFELECGYDYLRIYDGEDNTGIPLHPCTTNAAGGNGPGLTGLSTGTCTNICRPGLNIDTFTAKSGSMYIEMTSDDIVNYAGFEAYWWSKPKQVDPPEASFEAPATICVDIPADFKNTSTGESVRYLWDLDDDMTTIETTSMDAAYMYFAPGKYTITLIAYNCGGSDTFSREITIINPNPPAVSFMADNVKPTTNDIVTFSPDIEECVGEYMWRFTADAGPGKAVFMNGTKKSSVNPQVMFTDTGCYTVFLFAKNAGGEDSLELTCFIKVKSPYCVPSVTTGIGDIGISEVSLADVKSNVLLSNKSTQGVEDYQNFAATVSATLEAGVSYDLTVKRTTALNEVTRTFWIDWNLDGDFADAGEKVGEQKKSAAQSWTHRFKVPKTISVGATVMRIAINQGNLTNSACGPNRYGEYEDYRLYLTPDLTAPVITLLGEDTVYVEQGYSYTDAGATAEDNLNGNITALLKKKQVPTFDNTIPGTYLFRFDVSDSSGNPAETVTRVVIVTPDVTPPQLIVSGTDTIHVAVFDINYTDPEAVLAEDLVDGDLLGEVVKSGSANVNKVGIYTITFTVVDQTGNTAVVVRTIIVGDAVPPVITLNGSDTVIHEANTPYTDAGVTITDNYCTEAEMSANLLVTSNVNPSAVGTYTVVYNLTDCNGNKAQATRTVIVKDTKAPDITLRGDTLVLLDVFSTYANAGVNVSDNYGVPAVTITGTFYDNFNNGKATILGDYTVIYTASDSFGNTAAVTRIIRVVDREAPVIALKGVPTANVCRWAAYDDAGYEIGDNYWGLGDITVTPEGDYQNTLVEGVFSMRYRAEDKSGNVGFSEWRIIRVVEAGEAACVTGLGDGKDFTESINVFPNPSSGRFTVSFSLSSQEQVSARVFNPLGQEVASIAAGSMGAGTFTVDLSSHAGGVYMLHIIAGNRTVVKRFVINK